MLSINGPEFIVLVVVALIVIGPERLPHYAQQLGRAVRQVRQMAMGAREQVRAELGDEFDDVDWQKLDPRQYDPRRIVREALTDVWDDEPVKPVSARKTTAAASSPARPAPPTNPLQKSSAAPRAKVSTTKTTTTAAATPTASSASGAPFDAEAT